MTPPPQAGFLPARSARACFCLRRPIRPAAAPDHAPRRPPRPATAVAPEAAKGARQEELEKVQAEQKRNADIAARLKAELDAIGEDRRKLNALLIGSAATIRAVEDRIAAAEARLDSAADQRGHGAPLARQPPRRDRRGAGRPAAGRPHARRPP